MSLTNAVRIFRRKAQLTPRERALEKKALKEGYEDEVCGKCKTVFLAFKHFVVCWTRGCPMVARCAKGRRMRLLDALPTKVPARR